jgi:hypothetical protein
MVLEKAHVNEGEGGGPEKGGGGDKKQNLSYDALGPPLCTGGGTQTRDKPCEVGCEECVL